MRKILFILIILPILAISQTSYNMSLLGTYEWPTTEGNDIWGWVDPVSDDEYALVGLNDGFSCVNVSNPSNPIEEFYIADLNSTWRDVKTWGNYAYVTTEADAGLLIVDLTDMTGGTYWHVSNFTNPNGSSVTFTAAHNLYIDENGICYIFGASSSNGGSPSDGAIFLDVNTNPINPVYLGEWDEEYIHDGMARGDTMYAGCIYTGDLYIVDVSNKTNPIVLGTHQTPNAFTHNAWVSDDGNYVFTTDETSDAYIGSYDISDVSNIQEVDRIQSNPESNSIPHNTHVDGNFLVTSWYRDGTTVHDISNPHNLVQVAYYDSYTGSPSNQYQGDGFDGCWGTYPFLPSGIIISSDINSSSNGNARLLVYERGFSGACYLEGNVTDALTGNALNGVSVEILNTTLANNSSSNLLGDYVSGTANASSYDVVFSKSGYLNDTLSANLTSGVITILDAALQPLVAFVANGMVIDVAGNGIGNADVVIYNNDFTFNMTTDANGNFSINAMYEGSYEVIAGKWGYITSCDNEYIDASSSITITLEEGYYDDFIFDFGWTVNGNASTGLWERGEPEGTILAVWQGTSYGALEFNPELDVSLDCGDFAFVTGNGGGSAGNDDVDDGNTVLTSPVFDAINTSANYLEYYKWFAIGGGSGNSSDELTISISNGITTALLETITLNSSPLNSWTYSTFDMSQYITLTTTMQLIIETADLGSGDLIEAAFDKFAITNTTPTINEQELTTHKGKLINIVDVLGRIVNETVKTPLFYMYDDGTVEKRIIIE